MTRGAVGRVMAIMAMFAGALAPDNTPLIKDDDHAARISSRIARAQATSYTGNLGPAALDDLARRRRRARQTHPGKRGKV